MTPLTTNQWIVFAAIGIIIIIFSKHVIFRPSSHGFYRFFGWMSIAWLLANNYPGWFDDFFSVHKICSSILLLYSTFLIIAGIVLMKTKGKAHESRQDNSLYSFERTTELIETGLYKYIRHPLYSSLVFLTWGICLRNPDLILIIISAFGTFFFFATMLVEEKENIAYFGDKYKAYMKRSKMCIPFLL
jgi:protein-S-isoprenylcysteine O-methyltransferase Ste14